MTTTPIIRDTTPASHPIHGENHAVTTLSLQVAALMSVNAGLLKDNLDLATGKRAITREKKELSGLLIDLTRRTERTVEVNTILSDTLTEKNELIIQLNDKIKTLERKIHFLENPSEEPHQKRRRTGTVPSTIIPEPSSSSSSSSFLQPVTRNVSSSTNMSISTVASTDVFRVPVSSPSESSSPLVDIDTFPTLAPHICQKIEIAKKMEEEDHLVENYFAELRNKQ
jgi:hypothetical protein